MGLHVIGHHQSIRGMQNYYFSESMLMQQFEVCFIKIGTITDFDHLIIATISGISEKMLLMLFLILYQTSHF